MAVLLGRTSGGTISDFEASGNAIAWPFTAVASGDLVRIYFHPKQTNSTLSSFELGIYTNSSGVPGSKLGSALVSSGFTGVGPFFADLATPVAIAASTVYWLAGVGVGENWNFLAEGGFSYSVDAAASPLPATWVQFATGTVEAVIWGESVEPVPTTDVFITLGTERAV